MFGRAWVFLSLTSIALASSAGASDDFSSSGNKGHELIYQTLRNLKRTLNSLSHILTFYDKDYLHMNLDAAVGTTIVEGQLAALTENFFYALRDDNFLLQYLPIVSSLQKKAHEVNKKVLPHIRSAYARQYQHLGRTLQLKVWEESIPKRSTNTALSSDFLPDINAPEAMSESTSDRCLGELFGSYNANKAKCMISDLCWDYMSRKDFHRYSLTHQLLFFYFAKRIGCGPEVEKRAQEIGKTTNEIVEQFISHVKKEMELIASDDFSYSLRDLFMEQGVICGLWGYEDVFRPEWLDRILSWQRSSGCFGNLAYRKISLRSLSYLDNMVTNSKPLIRVKRTGREANSKVQYPHNRKKREENLMDDGCSAHETAVAAANLVLYVRYDLERLNELYS